MALSDKNIVITPNIGASADPKIVFSGADSSTAAQNITLQVYPTNSGTLSFEGSTGQLFSITNSMTGTIYSVNDVSGIPSIEVLDTGVVKLAQFGGLVGVGTADFSYVTSDNTSLGSGSNAGFTNNKLYVNGSIQLLGNTDSINFGRGTGTFVKDEEIGFGWGSGWYMQDSSYLRVRNNISVYSTGGARFSIMYDTDNTSYYCDPASTSSMNVVTAASKVTTYYHDCYAGNGYGLRFWESDSYKVSMGNSSLYVYGTVSDYSIKMQMDDGSTGRGFTWGRLSYAPIASLNSTSGNFQTAGTIYAGGNITAYSDIKLKTNILTIENPIEKVKALRGITYNRVDQDQERRQTGVIAQDVEKVLPEAVIEDDMGVKTVAYGNIVGLLIEAIKEQQSQIEELKSELKALRG